MGSLGVAVFAAALLFSLGEMGFMTAAANNLIAFGLTLVFLVINRPRQWGRIRLGSLLTGILLLILAAILAQRSDLWRLLAFAAVPAALVPLTQDRERRSEMVLLVAAVVSFMLFWVALRHVPYLWWLSNRASVALSGAVGRVIGQRYAFSATTSGFRILALVAAWGFSGYIWSRHRRLHDLALLLILLIIIASVVQILLTPLALVVQHWAPDLDFLLFNPQVFYLLAALVPITLYRRRILGRLRTFTDIIPPKLLPVIFVAGLLVGFGLTFAPRQGPGGGKILLLDKGYLDWNVPVFDRYGDHSGGMFGRLPGWLEAQGYKVEIVPGPLDSETLSGSRALVVINLMYFLEPEEKQAVWDYVKAGGSLLILGDHTGVKGIRVPFNDLLKPVKIEFEFDSATFWAQGWRDALELLPHPINRGIIVAEDIQIWVGASLAFSPPTEPVIVGKYGYSDIGDAAKIDRSYLGDRRYNPGELLGDVCLVADAPYGKGRVLVFGDTSPFQNGALVTSWAFAQRVFQWLTGEPRSSAIALRVVALIIALALIMLTRRTLGSSLSAWLALGLGVVVAVQVVGRLTAPPPPPEIDLPKAVVDLSHGERFDQLTWYEDCVGGLELNLARNGYCTMLMREFSEPLIRDSEVMVVIAPAKAFSPGERTVIQDFMEAGGMLIVSTGYEEKDRSESLLSIFGAEIRSVPLAHFDVSIFDQTVRFAEAWPLKISDPEAVAVAYHPAFPDPIMVFVPRGKGGALIIGDSQFLLNSNLEAREEWYLGNIMFLRELFDRFKAGGFDR